MLYSLQTTHQYLKDIKLAKKRGLNIEDLLLVVELIQQGQALPAKYHNHVLKGEYSGCFECHINPDWLLIYDKSDVLKLITLIRTGSHSDLF